jgi:hypothetical protein
MNIRVLLPEDKDVILAFARARHDLLHEDPMERELQSWTAPWRAEALDHYLKLGWSYGAFANGKLIGFLLAQPILFFRALTQTLWVESLISENLEITQNLLDTVHKWARDKHFQCVWVEGQEELREQAKNLKQALSKNVDYVEVRSSRY